MQKITYLHRCKNNALLILSQFFPENESILRKFKHCNYNKSSDDFL